MALTIKDIEVLKPSLEEYKRIDWDNVYHSTKGDNEWSNLTLNHYFRKELNTCLEHDNSDRAKIFHLFYIVTSPILSNPKSSSNPYTPVMIYNTERTPILDDLSEDDIEFLKQIVPDIKTTALKARINDTLWLFSKPKDTKYAEGAILAYSNYPLNHKEFQEYFSQIAFERALYLSKILGKKERKF